MSAESPAPSRAADFAAAAARFLLGGLFIWLGAVKALDPVGFLKLVRQYELTSNPHLLNAMAGALPWFEIFCGTLLICGVAVRGVSFTLAVILAAFTWAVWRRALALAASRAIPFCLVKFDCGCGNGEVLACHKIPENIGLIVLAVYLVFARSRALSLRHALFPPGISVQNQNQ